MLLQKHGWLYSLEHTIHIKSLDTFPSYYGLLINPMASILPRRLRYVGYFRSLAYNYCIRLFNQHEGLLNGVQNSASLSQLS